MDGMGLNKFASIFEKCRVESVIQVLLSSRMGWVHIIYIWVPVTKQNHLQLSYFRWCIIWKILESSGYFGWRLRLITFINKASGRYFWIQTFQMGSGSSWGGGDVLRRRRWRRDFENILYPIHYWDFLLPCIVVLTVTIFLNQLFFLSSIQQYINLRGGSPTLPLITPN